jgi:hypothetical protein
MIMSLRFHGELESLLVEMMMECRNFRIEQCFSFNWYRMNKNDRKHSYFLKVVNKKRRNASFEKVPVTKLRGDWRSWNAERKILFQQSWKLINLDTTTSKKWKCYVSFSRYWCFKSLPGRWSWLGSRPKLSSASNLLVRISQTGPLRSEPLFPIVSLSQYFLTDSTEE